MPAPGVPPTARRARDLLRRAGITSLVSLVVVASLLTFPSCIPWMIAGWLGWHTVLVAMKRPAWFPLAACLVIVITKRLPWPPAFVALGVLMLAADLHYIPRIRERIALRHRLLEWAGVAALWVVWAGVAVEWHAAAHTRRRAELDATRPVACVGDSLTSGMTSEGGYPGVLKKMLSVPVVDQSQPGVTSGAALEEMPKLIAARPQAIVIELGGHDYLSGMGRASTKANLEEFIAAAREIGAEVVLMEVPRGFATDPFAGLERELAREHDLELVPDTAIRKLVIWSPYTPPGMWTGTDSHYSDDGLHPNARGNVLLAQYVADALERVFGPAIRVTVKR